MLEVLERGEIQFQSPISLILSSQLPIVPGDVHSDLNPSINDRPVPTFCNNMVINTLSTSRS
jgi:hypothetical protein